MIKGTVSRDWYPTIIFAKRTLSGILIKRLSITENVFELAEMFFDFFGSTVSKNLG